MTLLRFDRQRRDRARVETAQRDRVAGFDAIAVGAVFDARERGFDLGDQLALAIARPKLDRAIRFGRGAIGDVGVILALVLQRVQRVAAFGQNRFAPCDQFSAEIFLLTLVHEGFGVRGFVAFRDDIVHA